MFTIVAKSLPSFFTDPETVPLNSIRVPLSYTIVVAKGAPTTGTPSLFKVMLNLSNFVTFGGLLRLVVGFKFHAVFILA